MSTHAQGSFKMAVEMAWMQNSPGHVLRHLAVAKLVSRRRHLMPTGGGIGLRTDDMGVARVRRCVRRSARQVLHESRAVLGQQRRRWRGGLGPGRSPGKVRVSLAHLYR